jgi:hypothetical protein
MFQLWFIHKGFPMAGARLGHVIQLEQPLGCSGSCNPIGSNLSCSGSCNPIGSNLSVVLPTECTFWSCLERLPGVMVIIILDLGCWSPNT